MVTRYNATLADALAPLASVDGGALDAASEPTLTEATFLWDRAAQRVRLAFFRASLSPTTTASSEAEEMAKTAEALATSALVLGGNASLFREQEGRALNLAKQADMMIGHVGADGKWIPGEIDAMRQVLLANGASAQLATADTRIGSWQTLNQDSDVDLSPGGDDVPYATFDVTFEDGDAL